MAKGKKMENGDEWLAKDKFQHMSGCFLIVILIFAVLDRMRYRILRRWSVPIGAVVSLAAGAAKEAGDEVGIWDSAGASVKDYVADVAGVLIACVLLSLFKSCRFEREVELDRAVSMI